MSESEVKNLEAIFEQRIANDEKIEPKDWMPEKYRKTHPPNLAPIQKLLGCCLREIGLPARPHSAEKSPYWPKCRMKAATDCVQRL
jgi:hypothetical protein